MVISRVTRSRVRGPLFLGALYLAAFSLVALMGCGGCEDAAADSSAGADAPVGWPANTEFETAQGIPCTLGAQDQTRATLLLFYGHDCPISNTYVPEIKRIAQEYAERQVRTLIVFADRHLGAEVAAQHVREFEIPCPALVDAESVLAKHYGATVMPEAALVDPQGRLLYRGRIDNLFADYGKKRRQATQHELREALESYLAGDPIKTPRTEAIGCFID